MLLISMDPHFNEDAAHDSEPHQFRCHYKMWAVDEEYLPNQASPTDLLPISLSLSHHLDLSNHADPPKQLSGPSGLSMK